MAAKKCVVATTAAPVSRNATKFRKNRSGGNLPDRIPLRMTMHIQTPMEANQKTRLRI